MNKMMDALFPCTFSTRPLLMWGVQNDDFILNKEEDYE